MRKNQNEKGITLVALVVTIVVLIILSVITIGSLINHELIKRSAKGAEKYTEEMENEKTLLDNVANVVDKIETNEIEEPKVELYGNKKVVEVGTNKKISDYVGNSKLNVVYDENNITNINQLPTGKYTFLYNETSNQIEAIREVTEIPDLSGKNHTLYLKNGANIQQDSDGNYYINFDGADDYGQIMELEESVNWADGFEIEIETTWRAFNKYSYVFSFSNGTSNVYGLGNYSTTSTFRFIGINTFAINVNEKAKYKMNYKKNENGTTATITISRNGEELYKNESAGLLTNEKKTTNYLAKSAYSSDGYFNGKVYSLKMTRSDGIVVLNYNINEYLKNATELYVIGNEYNADIPDISGKNHTLYLKNGTMVQKDADGDYYLNFDGADDYGQIMELEEDINWGDGFEIEFVANWRSFNNYSRIMDFGNGAGNDNIVIANYGTGSELCIDYYNAAQATGAPRKAVLVLNERARYNIKYEKNSEGTYDIKFLKNGIEFHKVTTTISVRNILRIANYLGRSNWGESIFNGKIYALKITQADGEVVLHYDIDKMLNKKKVNVEIANINDWNAMVAKANEGATFFGRTISLKANINLTEREGSYIPKFEGTLEGNNRKINGLNITGTAISQGMIGTNNGTIKNLNIEEGSIKSTYTNTGVVVGTNYGIVENVKVSGEVNGADNTGGIAGENVQNGEITGCINYATVSGNQGVGGISGRAGIITNCGNNGAVTASRGAVGGIGGMDVISIIGCYNKGNISGYGSPTWDSGYTSIGGIAGIWGPVSYSYNRGQIYGAQKQIGGICRKCISC